MERVNECVFVLFSFYLYICVCVCIQIQGPLRERCSIRPGASGLPYYCTSSVCVPDVIGLLAVWRHNRDKPKTKPTKEREGMAPLVCVPGVIGVLSVWRHNKPKTKNQKPWSCGSCASDEIFVHLSPARKGFLDPSIQSVMHSGGSRQKQNKTNWDLQSRAVYLPAHCIGVMRWRPGSDCGRRVIIGYGKGMG